MIHQDAIAFYPPPLPREANSTFRQWVEAHQDVYNRYDADLEAIRESHRITEADGDDLDRIGKMFGPLGRRGRRGDYDYRQYLTSLSNSFAGRGTVDGIAFAVASGILADSQDSITVEENFDELTYQLLIRDWQSHSTSLVDELSQLADPSVVTRTDPIKYECESSGVRAGADDLATGLTITLPQATVAVREQAVRHRTAYDDGFGAGEFDGTDDFGPSEGDAGEQSGYGTDYGLDYGE